MTVTASDTRTIGELGSLTIGQLPNIPAVRPLVATRLLPLPAASAVLIRTPEATIALRTIPEGEVKWRSS